MQNIFPAWRATGWVCLQSWFIEPGLICWKYPTDWLHSWHPLKQRPICFYGLKGFGHPKFFAQGTSKGAQIRNHEDSVNFLVIHISFTVSLSFIFGHKGSEASVWLVPRYAFGFFPLLWVWNHCYRETYTLTPSYTSQPFVLEAKRNCVEDLVGSVGRSSYRTCHWEWLWLHHRWTCSSCWYKWL